MVKDATKVAAQSRIVKPVGLGLSFMGQVQLIIEQVRPCTAHPSSRIPNKCLRFFDPLMDFQCFAKTLFIYTLETKTSIYLCAQSESHMDVSSYPVSPFRSTSLIETVANLTEDSFCDSSFVYPSKRVHNKIYKTLKPILIAFKLSDLFRKDMLFDSLYLIPSSLHHSTICPQNPILNNFNGFHLKFL